jgi:phosphogluconate dehydratase
MSGASGKVPAAIHVYPEALDGGPLARVEDGDIVVLDAREGILSIKVKDDELAARTPAKVDLSGYHTGYGRELFGWLRRSASNPEQGASFFWNHEA